MSSEIAKKLLALGAEVAMDAIDGMVPSVPNIARQLVSIGLDLVPADELRAYLSAEARRRIDAEIDAEQAAKTGGR